MEKFLALPEEKQKSITEAGFFCFGKLGYKKVSTGDIAMQAGISKAMLFHYFGSKKNLYLFLANKAFSTLMSAFREQYDPKLTDIFDKLDNLTACKVATLKKYPNLLAFLMGLYGETDAEVRPEIDELLQSGMTFRTNVVFTNGDVSKFKEGVDPVLVLKLLNRYSDGFVSTACNLCPEMLDEMQAEFTQCLNLLKQNLYREEYKEK